MSVSIKVGDRLFVRTSLSDPIELYTYWDSGDYYVIVGIFGRYTWSVRWAGGDVEGSEEVLSLSMCCNQLKQFFWELDNEAREQTVLEEQENELLEAEGEE